MYITCKFYYGFVITLFAKKKKGGVVPPFDTFDNQNIIHKRIIQMKKNVEI